ncbi:MAG: DUF4346 domain-containing protein, partial [Gemmatimonadota bacterium]
LGIERVIQNVLANPNIRFVVICGVDSRETIGHLPGQSLLALVQHGVDDHGRIVGARGKRPVLRNLDPGAIEHFRGTVEVIDLIGHTRVSEILRLVAECAARNPGPAEVFPSQRLVTTVKGYIPQQMVSDPNGYFVLYVDRNRGLLALEHYANNGVLDLVIEGQSAAELYVPAIERGLVSRLDHAAYLGWELARAERALEAGEKYVQDAAPERRQTTQTSCDCGTACGGDER